MSKNDTFKKVCMSTINEQPETVEKWPKEFATLEEMKAGLSSCSYSDGNDLDYHVDQLRLAIYSAEELLHTSLQKIVVEVDEELDILTYNAIFDNGVTFVANTDKYEWNRF